MSRKKPGLKITLRRGTRKNLAPTLSRETMARIRESLSNLLSMLNKILLQEEERQSRACFVCVESLVILLKIVRSERTRKRKRKFTS
jgi:hypothetical protein